MAGMGPPPNPNRRRRNKDTFTGVRRRQCVSCGSLRDADGRACPSCGAPDSSQPSADSTRGAPLGTSVREIPELPNPKRWLSATREWWAAWCSSAQVAHFEPSDWEVLKSLLPLVDAMHREKDAMRKARIFEIVFRAERALGGTHMERLRGRVGSVSGSDAGVTAAAANSGPEATPDNVAVLAEYREMLAQEG